VTQKQGPVMFTHRVDMSFRVVRLVTYRTSQSTKLIFWTAATTRLKQSGQSF